MIDPTNLKEEDHEKIKKARHFGFASQHQGAGGDPAKLESDINEYEKQATARTERYETITGAIIGGGSGN